MSDVSLETTIVSVDIGQVLDIKHIKEYVSKNFPKDCVFIDAIEIFESLKLPKLDPSTPHENLIEISSLVSKSIKTNIDSSIQKLLDLKKKNIKAAENTKKEKNPPPPPPIMFGGQTEAVIALINWPLVPIHYQQLVENDIHISAFINLTGFKATVPPTKSSNNKVTTTLPYLKIIGKTVPDTNIPLSWVQLQETADFTTIFSEIKLEEEPAQAWNTLQLEIGNILSAKKKIEEECKSIKIENVPTLPEIDHELDLSTYTETLKKDENDYITAIFEQLHKNNFQIFPKPEISELDLINDILDQFYNKLANKQIQQEEIKPKFFKNSKSSPSFFVENMINSWNIPSECAESAAKAAEYYTSIEGFNTAAGQQFELLFTKANKQYSLGLPINYYDFTKFTKMINYDDSIPILNNIMKMYNIVEVSVDNMTGIVYVLALPPAQKSLGKQIQYKYMPVTMKNGNELFLNMNETSEASQTPDKKNKNNSILNLIKNNESPTQIFQNIQEIIKTSSKIYGLPSSYNFSTDFVSPYFFDNFRVDILREIWNGTYLFKYNVFATDFDVHSEDDSISIDFGEFRVNSNSDSINIFHENNSFSLKSGKLTINNNIIIDRNGDFVYKLDKSTLYTSFSGVAGYTTKDSSIFNDKFGNGSEKVHKKTNLVEKKRDYIRNDDVKYAINLKDQSRTINLKNITIKQNDKVQEFILPGLQTILSTPEMINFQIGQYQISISDKIEIKKGDLVIVVSSDVNITDGKTEMSMNCNEIQIKSGKTGFIATNTGIERLADIFEGEPPPKKRPEFAETKFGLLPPVKEVLPENVLLNLQKQNPPRFFAIRPNLSGTEFLHPEYAYSLKSTEEKPFEKESPSDSQGKVTKIDLPNTYSLGNGTEKQPKPVNSANDSDLNLIPPKSELFKVQASINGENVIYDILIDEFMRPISFISFNPLDKTHRAEALKEIAAPRQRKPKKGEKLVETTTDVNEKAVSAIASMNSFFTLVSEAKEAAISLAKKTWHESRIPKPPRVPDLDVMPPQTPPPGVLIAANLKGSSSIQARNYWESPEANFVYVKEIEVKQPRPPSARMKLFDPPRHFIMTDKDIPDSSFYDNENKDNNIMTSTKNRSTFMTQPDEQKYPESARAPRRHGRSRRTMKSDEHPQRVDFGEVPAGREASTSLEITNTGFVPFKYSIIQPEDKNVKILTAPGIVMAGFKLKIRLQLLPCERGEISTSFRLLTPDVDMEIPVTAIIV